MIQETCRNTNVTLGYRPHVSEATPASRLGWRDGPARKPHCIALFAQERALCRTANLGPPLWLGAIFWMLMSEFHYDGSVHRLMFWLLSGLVVSAQTSPKVTGVLNGASFGSHLSPGTLASLFGSNLATATRSADSIPLPTDILGTRVLVQGPSMPGPIAAPIYFVSLGQINFQIPFEVVRSSVTIIVSTAQGSSDPVKVNLDAVAPGIFSRTADGSGDAIAFHAGFKLLTRTPDNGSTVILYATGIGATTPTATSLVRWQRRSLQCGCGSL
jgi:uncharacterized protein (TIGR03437 family)